MQRQHEFAESADVLAEIIEHEPLNSEAQLLHADVLLHDGRIHESRLACIRVALSGEHVLAGYCAVQALTAAGEHDRAFAAVQKLSPRNLSPGAQVWALEIAADAAWKAGHLPEAKLLFEQAMAFADTPHSLVDAYSAFTDTTQM